MDVPNCIFCRVPLINGEDRAVLEEEGGPVCPTALLNDGRSHPPNELLAVES